MEHRAPNQVRFEFTREQFDSILKALAGKEWRFWIQVLIIPVIIAATGYWLTERYNQTQLEINKAQALEKFVAYFSGDHPAEQRAAALRSVIELGYPDLAADLLVSSSDSSTELDLPSYVSGQQATIGQPAIWGFVLSQGESLLPRLCYLVGAAGDPKLRSRLNSPFGLLGGPGSVALNYATLIGQSEKGFGTLRELAFAKGTDEATREGALSSLSHIVHDRNSSLFAEEEKLLHWSKSDDLESQPTALDQQIDALRDEFKALTSSSEYSERAKVYAIDALQEYGEDGAELVRHILADNTVSATLRLKALYAIFSELSVDDDFLDFLDKLSEDRNQPEVLRRAIAALRGGTALQGDPSLLVFKTLLESPWPEDHRVAVSGLVQIKSDESLPILLRAYRAEKDIDVKCTILASLYVYTDSEEVSGLLKTTALTDQSFRLREAAFAAIARRIEVPDAELARESQKVLIEGLKETDNRILFIVIGALSRIPDQGIQRILVDRINKIEDPSFKAYVQRLLFFGNRGIAQRGLRIQQRD